MSPVEEMYSKFNVLYDNSMSSAVGHLDEFEASYYLTKGQDEVLKNHINPAGNKYRQGLDDSSKRQLEFSNLIKTEYAMPRSGDAAIRINPNSLLFTLPENIFSILVESIELWKEEEGEQVYVDSRQVVPISHDEYARMMKRPFHEPKKRQAWKLLSGEPNKNPLVELITTTADSKYNVLYKVQYVRMPRPIIVANLTEAVGEGVTLGGLTGPCECELDKIVHEEIIQRAVELAKAAYGSDTNGQLQMQNQITVGQRSE